MDGLSIDVQNEEHKNSEDPFADVVFNDFFMGGPGMATQTPASGNGHELFDIFGSSSKIPQGHGNPKNDVNDLVAGLSINGNESKRGHPHPEMIFSDSTTTSSHNQSNDVLNNLLKSQAPGIGANPMFTMDPMTYNALSSGLMFNPTTFGSQPINYDAMSSLLVQQQFLSTMSNLQQMGYVVQDQMCESCSRVQANSDQWVVVVQIRQHVSHRRTFLIS